MTGSPIAILQPGPFIDIICPASRGPLSSFYFRVSFFYTYWQVLFLLFHGPRIIVLRLEFWVSKFGANQGEMRPPSLSEPLRLSGYKTTCLITTWFWVYSNFIPSFSCLIYHMHFICIPKNHYMFTPTLYYFPITLLLICLGQVLHHAVRDCSLIAVDW